MKTQKQIVSEMSQIVMQYHESRRVRRLRKALELRVEMYSGEDLKSRKVRVVRR